MRRRNSPDWIVARDGTGADAYSLECLRCGVVQRFTFPFSVTYWIQVAKAFAAEHRRCKPTTEDTEG